MNKVVTKGDKKNKYKTGRYEDNIHQRDQSCFHQMAYSTSTTIKVKQQKFKK